MNQAIFPTQLIWQAAPLPSPDQCHPNCRIALWDNDIDLEAVRLYILHPKAYTLLDGTRTYHSWADKQGVSRIAEGNQRWAWFRSWNALKE